jgi:phosphatidylserine/phosphatidylglycerophosphate/cardiolipin synthase-like enzyme
VSALRTRGLANGAHPWRQGNHFQLLSDGERFFARMLESIEQAREYVLLEMYLVESGQVADRFIDAFVHAIQRGARVLMLLDAFGASGLSASDRQRLLEAGAQLRFYNAMGWRKRLANLARDHRKLLLVDGRVAFVGGAGLTDQFAAGGGAGTPWREVMLEIRGPVLADWQDMFAAGWRKAGGEWMQPNSPAHDTVADGAAGRVALSAGWHRSVLANSVVHRIETARQHVWMMSAYFVPSRRFRKALRRAVRRGVDVRLFVPGPLTDHPWVRHAARRFYGKLLRNGVRIFEFQPRVLHAKMILCDDWVSVGSSNLDRWGFKWNLEANQEIEDRPFANTVAAVFEEDRGQSLELDPRQWPRRGWLNRFREHVAGILDRGLERWRRPRSP